MSKKKAKYVNRPINPRSLQEWEAGNWPSATANKIKYFYCKSGQESLVSIARNLSGKKTDDKNFPKYKINMTWQDITMLNFGTIRPTEINWYLENFNGCGRKITYDGKNYMFDQKDDRPWLWIPAIKALPSIEIKILNESEVKINLPPTKDEFSQALEDKFDEIDKKENQDGFLSKKEIDLALGDSIFSGIYGAMIATLKKHLGDFEELSDDEWGDENDGITRADMTAYDRLRLNDPNNDVVRKLQGMYLYAKDKINSTNHSLFAGSVDPLSVEQGMIGDCWFLAAIVGVANRSEQEIKDMIAHNSGNLYNVKFPGIPKSIDVAEPTDGEIAIFSGAGTNGLWLSVLEKAYGAAVNRDAYFFVSTSHYDAADAGAFISKGISIMTGHSVDSDILVPIVHKEIELLALRGKLRQAFQNNKVVVAGIRGGIIKDYRANGLPMGHAYTIMNYNEDTDRISVRNPWGSGGPTGIPIHKGVFEMLLTDFWDNFSFIAFEE